MPSSLKGKDFREQWRKARQREGIKSVNPITEFMDDPQLWDVDDPRYDWLSDGDREYLKSFEFDYYDIMQCAGHFMTLQEACAVLMTDQRTMDKYVQALWGKPLEAVYEALRMTAKNAAVKDIFMKYANMGNTTAMNIMANNVMHMNESAHRQDMRIQIVNDIGGEGK